MKGRRQKAEGKSEDGGQRRSHQPLMMRTLVFTFAFCLFTFAFCLSPSAHAAWSKQRTGSFAWLHSVFFVGGGRGWAVGGKGALLETRDGGEHWEARRRPTEDALKDVFFTDEQTGWVVCERSIYMPMRKDESVSYLLKTTDGGETWSRVEVTRGEDVDLKLARVTFADAEHGWVLGEMGALFATADGGATWTRQRVPDRHLLLGASFLDARTGWIVGAGASLLYTSDGGATWRAGLVNGSLSQFAQRAASRARTQDGASSYSTPPASKPTVESQASLRVNAVSFADARRGWAVGAGGLVLATIDGGRTWRTEESGTESELFDVKFFDEREGWAVGGEGVAIHTADGGATWHAEATGTPHTLERLFFSERTRGWAVGFGGTIIAFKG